MYDAQDKADRSMPSNSTVRLECMQVLMSENTLMEALMKLAPVRLVGGRDTPL